jgi:UDP-glucose 4-epimerase
VTLPRVVAVTGLTGFAGARSVERLLRWTPAPTVVGLDRALPPSLESRIEFRCIDLCDPAAEVRLAEILEKERCEAVLHAAFHSDPQPDRERQRELEVLGSLAVMSAVSTARVRKLVVTSHAEVYGARPDNPALLSESQPLRPHPEAHQAVGRAEVESLLRAFAARHRGVIVTSLRPCWVIGPSIDSAAVRRLVAERVTVPLGYDPLVQFLHECDWITAIELALRRDARGAFNLAGEGALPLSTLLRLAGVKPRPRPVFLLHALGHLAWLRATGDPPAAWYDSLRYPCVLDVRRARVELGFRPLYTTREAWLSAFVARRLEALA